MASASPKLIPMMLVIAISMAILVSLGQAASVQAQVPLPDPLNCSVSMTTGGCLNDVENLILNGQITSATPLSNTCCTALADLGESCWSTLFPLNPYVPTEIQNYCAAVYGDVAPGTVESSAAEAPTAESPAETGSDSTAANFFLGA